MKGTVFSCAGKLPCRNFLLISLSSWTYRSGCSGFCDGAVLPRRSVRMRKTAGYATLYLSAMACALAPDSIARQIFNHVPMPMYFLLLLCLLLMLFSLNS